MKKENKKVFVIIFIVIFIAIVLNIYKCPFKYIFGISCPLCGFTRAIYYFLKLDIEKSFYYHLLWPFIVLIIFLHILIEFNILKIDKKISFIVLYIFCILNLVYYFYRLFNNSNVVYFDFNKSVIYKILF